MAIRGIVFGFLTVLSVFDLISCGDLVFITKDPNFPRARLEKPSSEVLDGLDQFSISLFVKVNSDKTNSMTVVSYCSDKADQNNELVVAIVPNTALALYIGGEKIIFDGAPKSGNWSHVCITWELQGDAQLYIDGEIVDSKPGPKTERPLAGNGIMVLGQDQDDCDDDSYEEDDGLNGRLNQFHMWDRVLSESEIQEMASCSKNQKGNLIDWSNSTWTLEGKVLYLPKTEVCQDLDGGSGSEEPTETKSCDHPKASRYDLQAGNKMLKPGQQVTVTATLDGSELPAFKQLSLCFWMYNANKAPDEKFEALSLELKGETILAIRPQAKSCFRFMNPKGAECADNAMRIYDWVHHCFVWNNGDGSIMEYGNGELVKDFGKLVPGFTLPAGMKVVVRQVQSEALDKSSPTKWFMNKVTGINVFKRAITKEEVKKLYDCTDSIQGDAMNWSASKFSVTTK